MTQQVLPEIRLGCWSCQSETDRFFCRKCGKIQPIPPGADYFNVLGFDRRLRLPSSELEKRFHELSRRFHPDFFMNDSEREQTLSLENASVVNKAYSTLKDPVHRIEYLLTLESGNQESVHCQVPPDLLEEVLDLHSRLEEIESERGGSGPAKMEENRQYLQRELSQLEERFAQMNQQLMTGSEKWDSIAGGDLAGEKEKGNILEGFRRVLSHRTYLENVIEEIRKSLRFWK